MNKNAIAAIFSLLMLALLLAGIYFFIPFSSSRTSAPTTDQLTALETRLVAKEQQTTALAALQIRAQTLEDMHRAQFNKLIAEQEQIARRLAVLERDIAARPLPGALVKGSDIAAMRQELETRLSTLAHRIRAPRRSAFALLALSLNQLKAGALAGAPFATELKIIARLMGSSLTLDNLALYQTGVPSRATLNESLARHLTTARQQAAPAASSPLTALLHRVFNIRRLSEQAGTSAPALLSQLTARMEEGDIAKALRLKPALTTHPKAFAPLADWFAAAARREALNAHLIQLDREVYNLLAANIKTAAPTARRAPKQNKR